MKCEFSLTHYKECIELARDKGYRIIPVKEIANLEPGKIILLQHDIDFSLEYAYELANFEYDLGIKSSYYLYLHSELYNALSPKGMGMIKQMKDMGHELGLHYDSRYLLHCEGNIMHDLTQEKQMTYSQHWPASNDRLKGDISEIKYVKYISDSGRNWREGCMCQHIGKHSQLRISTHPEWWIGGGVDRWNAICNMFVNYQATLARNITDVKNMIGDYEREVINKK